MKSILLFCVLGLVLFSCKPQDQVAPADTCQLTRMVSGNATNDFLYDGAGQLTRWVITRRWNAMTTQVIQCDFIRDRSGRISSMTQTGTINGQKKRITTVQFSYTSGLLTSTSAINDGLEATKRTFHYDPAGRMIEQIITDPRDATFTSTITYKYDSRGNCIEYHYSDSDSLLLVQEFTYDTSKNPEQLLIKSIPFNLQTDLPWSVHTLLTMKQTNIGPSYPFQEPSIVTSKQTDQKIDAKGYVLSTTLAEDQGYAGTTAYSLINCQ